MSSIQTLKDLPIRNSRIQLNKLSVGLAQYLDNLNSNLLYKILSKAFKKSTVIISTQLPLSTSLVISSNNSEKLETEDFFV